MIRPPTGRTRFNISPEQQDRMTRIRRRIEEGGAVDITSLQEEFQQRGGRGGDGGRGR